MTETEILEMLKSVHDALPQREPIKRAAALIDASARAAGLSNEVLFNAMALVATMRVAGNACLFVDEGGIELTYWPDRIQSQRRGNGDGKLH